MDVSTAWRLVLGVRPWGVAGLFIVARTLFRWRIVLAGVKTSSAFGQTEGGGVFGRHTLLQGFIVAALGAPGRSG